MKELNPELIDWSEIWGSPHTEQELLEIETMAGLGLSFDEIASIKGLCDDTLKKHAKPFLKRGKAKAKAQVMQTAYRMAISGKIPSMTMFWLKAQAGWREGKVAPDSLENNLSSLVEQINQSNKPSQILLAYLAEVLDQLKQGVLDSKVASSIASMSNILLKAAEQGQLEERLASLERVIKSQISEPLDMELELDSGPTSKDFSKSAKGNFSKRLDKLVANLTPKQLTLKYLEHVLSCPNGNEWLRIFYSDDFSSWLEQSLENMRTSVQRNIKDPLEKEKAVHKVNQEFAYLFTMALWPCEELEEMLCNNRYQFGCIALLLKNKAAAYLSVWSEEMKSNFLLAKRLTENLWLELKVAQLTETKISEQFFDGQPLLRTSQQQTLEEYINLLERTMELLEKIVCDVQQFSRFWRRKKGGWEMMAFLKDIVLDREALLQEAVRQADMQFLDVKRHARIAVYQMEDRHDEVRKIYQQKFNGSSSSPAKEGFEEP